MASDVSLAFNAVGRDRGVNALLSRTSNNVRAANLAAAASTVAMGAAMASAGAHALALASSAAVAAGAIAAVPAALAAGYAGMGAYKAVTFGLADAWKATGVAATGGGGAAKNAGQQAVSNARAVRDATEALADAKRDEALATAAVNRARVEEKERLEDLSRSLAGSRLDEESATRAVAKAAQDLAVARAGGTNYDIEEADLAYRQAQQTLVDTKDRVQDLSTEQADGAKKGVEGSDAVQDALRRQQDAQRQVTRAAEQLADSQQKVQQASAAAASGGIDPAAAALAKLSPNGRAVILMLRQLAPAWQQAARAGQQATFAGVAGDLRDLSGIYLPRATTWLTRMGGSFNLAVRQSLGLAQTKSTIRDVDTFTNNVALSTDRLARAVRPVINGILQWVTIGSNFLPGLAGNTLTIAQRFERWSVEMRKSGQAASWIGRGIAMLRQFAAIATDVTMSVVAIFRAGDDGGSTVDGLQRGAAAMRKWLESAQGQEKVKQVLATLRGVLAGVGAALLVVAGHGDEFNDALNVTGTVVKFASGHLGTLAKLLPVIAGFWVLSKVAETGANVAKVIQVPLLAAQVVGNMRLSAALRAHTAALGTNTAATEADAVATGTDTAAQNTGILARGRAVVSMVAQKVALVATTIATRTYAAAQWLLNAAMTANPIGLIIAAVIALIAVVVLIATRTTWFQTAWRVAWGAIKSAASAVGTWFRDTLWKSWILGAWNGIVNKGKDAVAWFSGFGGRLKSALRSVATILSAPFRTGFNLIARLWNGTVGRISFTVPGWVPGLGGRGFSVPNIPQLAKGGIVPATPGGRLVNVAEGGEDEVVAPLSKLSGMVDGGGSREVTVRVVQDYRGAETDFIRWIRKTFRVVPIDTAQGA
jgi:hypothetical protein